jgi:hypothetical protein
MRAVIRWMLSRHAESVRAVKVLQRTYAQYSQYGLWNEMAALFADDARLTFGDDVVTGPDASVLNDRLQFDTLVTIASGGARRLPAASSWGCSATLARETRTGR